MAHKNKIVSVRGNLIRLVGYEDYEDFDYIPKHYTRPQGGKVNAQTSKQALQDSK
jgi:hypothetical protein